MTDKVLLATVSCGIDRSSTSQYCEFIIIDAQANERHFFYQSKTSTSGCTDPAAEASSWLIVTAVRQGNARVPLGQPKEILFSIDYLELNKIIERESAMYRPEYRIPESIKWHS